jgi:hypothetical protein
MSININTHCTPLTLPSLTNLINKVRLRQRQRIRRLSRAHHAIRLNRIPFGINLHLGSCIVELHISLTNLATILDSLDTLAQAVGFDDAGGDGRLRDEGDAG